MTRFETPEGLSAALYALTHRGNRGDLEFYRRTCRGARSVLELGSGYGRVLLALAGSQRRVVGLERDPQFLALARRNLRQLSPQKRQSVRLVQGDLRDFQLAERFERVFLPYNALYCLLSKQAALGCFRSVHRALKPGGVFAFDVWNAAPFDAAIGALPDDDEPIVSLSYGSRTWDVFERSRLRRARKRLDVTYHYRPRAGGAVHRIAIPQRYYLAAEVAELLERAGFAVQARYGDFSGSRFTARSAQQVVLARAL
jgi:SAM-dependent methyltransferase